MLPPSHTATLLIILNLLTILLTTLILHLSFFGRLLALYKRNFLRVQCLTRYTILPSLPFLLSHLALAFVITYAYSCPHSCWSSLPFPCTLTPSAMTLTLFLVFPHSLHIPSINPFFFVFNLTLILSLSLSSSVTKLLHFSLPMTLLLLFRSYLIPLSNRFYALYLILCFFQFLCHNKINSRLKHIKLIDWIFIHFVLILIFMMNYNYMVDCWKTFKRIK